jgi:hypothetical protein
MRIISRVGCSNLTEDFEINLPILNLNSNAYFEERINKLRCMRKLMLRKKEYYIMLDFMNKEYLITF